MHFKKTSLTKQQNTRKLKKALAFIFEKIKNFLLSQLKYIKQKIQNTANQKPKLVKQKTKKINTWKKNIVITITLIIASFSTFFVFEFASSINITDYKANIIETVEETLGADLPTDKNGFTNILVLGLGGKQHDGGDLTDSIIVASIDKKTKKINMLSIPRDLWIKTEITESRINEILRDAPGRWRAKGIQSGGADHKKAMETLQNVVTQLTGIKIHRYSKIDFRGFEKLVDDLEGIDVIVEKDIYDKYYPDNNWGYEIFQLKKGQQHLDGKKALQFARSRHGSSDFDRSRRQQKILAAIKDKVLKKEIFINPAKIQAIFETIKEHFETDISIQERITLAKITLEIKRSNIITQTLTDEICNITYNKGGLLVTPKRELYGGAAVLVPWLNESTQCKKYEQINAFANLIFYENDYIPKVKILNGTSEAYLASKTERYLSRYGIKTVELATAETKLDKTTIEYLATPKNKRTAKNLLTFINGQIIEKPVPKIETNEKIPQNIFEFINQVNNVNLEQYIPDPKDEIMIITLGKDFHKIRNYCLAHPTFNFKCN